MRKSIQYLKKAEDYKVFQGSEERSRVLILIAYDATWHYHSNELYYPLSPPKLPEKIYIEISTLSIDHKIHRKEKIYWFGTQVYVTDNNWGSKDPIWLKPFEEWLVKANTLEELSSIIKTIKSKIKELGIKEKITQLKESWG